MALKNQKSKIKNQKVPSKKKKQRKKNSGLKTVLYGISGLAVLALFGYLGYSAFVFQNSEEEQEGFFICNKENTVCELSQHIHASIVVNACGKDITFAKEKGKLDLQHTHKEGNRIHWHARMKVDPHTKEPFDKSLLSVQSFLDQMEYTFPESCPDIASPEVSVMINGKKPEAGLQATWKDGDKILVEYK